MLAAFLYIGEEGGCTYLQGVVLFFWFRKGRGVARIYGQIVQVLINLEECSVKVVSILWGPKILRGGRAPPLAMPLPKGGVHCLSS